MKIESYMYIKGDKTDKLFMTYIFMNTFGHKSTKVKILYYNVNTCNRSSENILHIFKKSIQLNCSFDNKDIKEDNFFNRNSIK